MNIDLLPTYHTCLTRDRDHLCYPVLYIGGARSIGIGNLPFKLAVITVYWSKCEATTVFTSTLALHRLHRVNITYIHTGYIEEALVATQLSKT